MVVIRAVDHCKDSISLVYCPLWMVARSIPAISPSALPQIFKNALTVPILLDIIKCVATFFVVPRFDTLIMFLSSSDNADLVKIWDEVFDNEATPIEYAETLDNLHTKYCPKR
ncbi:RNA polymerase II-associated protein 3 [Prunus yedoensis var. nudiflora]|uniref:RNA polymerase II-associated protein 3 n=1 Tax=Prunus yedoensis var. nudiflora TaxID=2094558 RepID=A0A314XVF8_PRUYE|nr:RNA polymerase II-associated protein 3 [Prunus yedoensis var. nudiflora]